MLFRVFLAAGLFVLTTAAHAAEPPVHDCDRLAAHPHDTQRADIAGLAFEDIDSEAAVEACKAAVDAYPGVNRFLYQLGRAHDARDGFSSAVPHYERAAEAGHVLSSYVLYWSHAEIFEQSQGTDEESRRKAVKWLQYGAEVQQDPDMQVQLGIALLEGGLLPSDPNAARDIFLGLAKDGHPDGQYFLGVIVLDHAGYDQELIDLAFEWLEAASVNGSPEATDFLMGTYRYIAHWGEGLNLTPEQIEAERATGNEPIMTYGRTREDMLGYFERAAEANHDWANFMLGIFHQHGKHVPKDLEKAKSYLERAKELGHFMAGDELERLEKSQEQQ